MAVAQLWQWLHMSIACGGVAGGSGNSLAAASGVTTAKLVVAVAMPVEKKVDLSSPLQFH